MLPNFAIYGGDARGAAGASSSSSSSLSMPRNSDLRHTEAGVLSLSTDGRVFAISLSRALKLDEEHQVVGRLCEGRDTLELLCDLRCSSVTEKPSDRIQIVRCGGCSHLGAPDGEGGSGGGGSDGRLTKESLEEASARTRDAVMEAVQAGLRTKTLKRKKEEEVAAPAPGGAGPSSSSAAAAASASLAAGKSSKGGAAAAAGGGGGGEKGGAEGKKAKGMLGAVLGDLSSDSDDDED